MRGARLIIAGTHSGVGKTTVTLGLLAAFQQRGLKVQPFKVGPDFIDPLYHTAVTGLLSRNLDGWMLSRPTVQSLFHRWAALADLSIIEGVMGLFDGYDGKTERGSTAEIAKLLQAPVILVVDAQAMARSAGAIVLGFEKFDPHLNLVGVILNRVAGKRHAQWLSEAIQKRCRAEVLGNIPEDKEIKFEERHLGLVTETTKTMSQGMISHLTDLMERSMDLKKILKLSNVISDPLNKILSPIKPLAFSFRPRIGVAKDEAFLFYYPDNLDLLEQYGAELVPFSPLHDQSLPEDIQGLYFGGGYPEVYAEGLSKNIAVRQQIKKAAQQGLPIYAECGGLMYLSKAILDLQGKRYPMAEIFPLEIEMRPHLSALRYVEVEASQDSPLARSGMKARGHEFHYSRAVPIQEAILKRQGIQKAYRIQNRQDSIQHQEGYLYRSTLASYFHLHFLSNPKFAKNFVAACHGYLKKKI